MVLCMNRVADWYVVAIGKDRDEAIKLALAKLAKDGAHRDEVNLATANLNQGEAIDFDAEAVPVPSDLQP